MVKIAPLIRWAKILIITAIPPELDAVLNAFEIDFEKDRSPYQDGATHSWHKRLLISSGNFYDIIVICLYEAGNVNAGIKTCQLINYWNPDAVLMVGIAGAANSSKPGDIVIGKTVHYYSGKITSIGQELEPKRFEADKDLIEQIRLFKPQCELLINGVPRPEGTLNPEIYKEASIASSEVVIASSEKRDEIANRDRRTRAIAMEDYGIYEAAQTWIPPVKCLSIRAISDFANEEKKADRDRELQPYAAAVAARYTFHYLRCQPIKCERTLTPLHQPLSESKQLEKYYKKELTGHYKEVAESIRKGKLVFFVGPGVNLYGKRLQTSESQVIEGPPSEIDIAEYLSQNYDPSIDWTGFPCLVCHTDLENRPRECPILKGCGENPEGFDCPLFQAQKLDIAKNKARYLSQYKELNDAADIQRLLNEFMQNKSQTPNELHRLLAKRLMRRGRDDFLPNLIVTTNYDRALEQAVEDTKKKFYLLSYIAQGENCGKFEYKLSDDSQNGIIADPNDPKLPTFTDHPVILKLFGGVLRENLIEKNRFVITEEDHINYLFRSGEQGISLLNLLPRSLMMALKYNDLLFLGYNPSDWDLRVILHRLCGGRQRKSKMWRESRQNQFEQDQEYSKKEQPQGWLIHQTQPGKFDECFWKDWYIKLIDSPLEIYVSGLKQQIFQRRSSNSSGIS